MSQGKVNFNQKIFPKPLDLIIVTAYNSYYTNEKITDLIERNYIVNITSSLLYCFSWIPFGVVEDYHGATTLCSTSLFIEYNN